MTNNTEQKRIVSALELMAQLEPSKQNESEQQRIAVALEKIADDVGPVSEIMNIIQSGWKGKTLYCYGDSVTEQGRWQPYLNRICEFGSVINGGHV